MAQRMSTWLRDHCPDSKTDWAWINRDSCWRPVKSYREVKRGKHKGWLMVELFYPEGRKRMVPPNHLKKKPEPIEQY